jgi:hypothetical protein
MTVIQIGGVMMFNKFLMIVMMFASLAVNAKSQINKCGDADKFPKLACKEIVLNLVEDDNPIKIKVYTKVNLNFQQNRTFVVTHNNEQKGLNAVKEVLSDSSFGGRLVEIESNYKSAFDNFKDRGNEKRYLHFGNGKFCVDPNRIYTKPGIKRILDKVAKESENKPAICKGTPNDEETIQKIELFADSIVKIVTNDNKHKFIIGVHNNTEPGSLDITYWLMGGEEAQTAAGIIGSNYHNNSKGLTKDDFVLVSNLNLFRLFFDINKPFTYSIALQEEKSYLTETDGRIKESFDDGSMSLYFGTKNFAPNVPFSYVNIEAGGKENTLDSSKKWQKEFIKRAIRIKL